MRSFWFGPEEIEILASALDAVLRALRLDRDDPATQVIAKRVIDLADLGELDPVRLRDHALEINRPTWEREHDDRLCATLKADRSTLPLQIAAAGLMHEPDGADRSADMNQHCWPGHRK